MIGEKEGFRLLAIVLTAALLLGVTGVCFAAEAPAEPITVAQFGDEPGRTSSTPPGVVDDFDEFDAAYNNQPLVSDPLSGWNRFWFEINDALYRGLFRPVAQGYAWAIPPRPRTWVSNFFTNLLFPVRFLNDLLTGKWDAAYMETSKFVANTSFGVLGLGDVTGGMPRNWEPERPTADGFDQTLGKAGIGTGIYLVWPFIGPSSVRGTVGWVADAYCDPLTYGKFTFLEFLGIRAYKNLNELSLQLEGNEYEALTDGAVDKYAAVRDAYIRYRAKKVAE
ncbi:MlaA family lipoprotein [Desulfovibrio caledoniensis]|jgi:phospholipid-binding lipoprotein MlaA